MGDYSQDFGADLLARLGAPVTTDNLALLGAWATAEGGRARWNPLNAREPAPGATDYMPAKAKNYPDYETGITATVRALQRAPYAELVDALLDDSVDALEAAVRLLETPWGTGAGAVIVLLRDGYRTPDDATVEIPT